MFMRPLSIWVTLAANLVVRSSGVAGWGRMRIRSNAHVTLGDLYD